MYGNERLAALMREAGFLREDGSVGRKTFARAVSTHAGRPLTHTYVSRWLDGMVPRDLPTRRAIATALGQRLGRTVGLEELGFGRTEKLPADLGLKYPDSSQEGIAALTRLWQGDLDQVHTLLASPTNVAAWNEASLSWLVSSAADVELLSTGARVVGLADLARVRTTVDLFDRLDAQFGGGHARRSLVEFLRNDLAQLLRGTYTDVVGRELFQVAASATMLGAWMSYDAGLHGLAQRYFVQALKLADAAGDRLLAAGILDAMSHQATFLGRYREAANLARAARVGTESAGSARSAAHFSAMEARALARLGDTAACDRAMAVAVREFERCEGDDQAEWFGYFDDAELAAELGHCNRDLGRAVDATTYAMQSVGGNGEQVRSDFFATMVLADAYLHQGEAEEACRVALTALQVGEQLVSARCASYVGEFRQRLDGLGDSPVARAFVEQARTTRLWATAVPSPRGSRRS
ncbi:regulator [Actinosynnema pretiosum]|uniref:Regulator n=1 Tax=Actinosynnema pretiosum TaxID=42197 RepID=A0A290ZET5_9PSEU|nr:regulator [Actinosynnema pretiosum]ATE57479.1 regulator [Actinosynnema pretiosum]